MKSIMQLLSFLSILAIFTACYPSQVSTSSNAMYDRDMLYANSWNLAELNGTTIKANGDTYSYLTFTPGSNRITGYTGCNYIGGTLSMTGTNNISFTPFATTRNHCVGNSIDVSLVPALQGVNSWGIVDDDLVMYKNGNIVARWTPSEYTNEDLHGDWQLSYVSDNSAAFDVLYPADKRPTLVFAKGKNIVSGTTGYNTYSCPVTINSNGLSFADCSSTKTPCEGAGESIFLNDLKTINNYTLADENTLVLFTDDNTVMKFTRIR